MKPLELKQRIDTYQSIPYYHPLTCGNDSNHENLVPVFMVDRIRLECPSCSYVQENIPEFFYDDNFSTENQLKHKEQMDKFLKGEIISDTTN